MGGMTDSQSSSLISGVLQLGSQFASNASTARQNRLNRNFQGEENEKNRQYAERMWRMNFDANNAYNSPTAQMQRLKDAGLNPHLAFEQGGQSVANQTSNTPPTPTGIAPIPAGRSATWDATPLADVALKMAQVDNIKADTAQKQSQTANNNVIAGINKIELENRSNVIANTIAEQNSRINVNSQQINESTQRVTNLISQNDEIKQNIENLIVKNKLDTQQVQNLVATLALIQAQKRNVNAQTVNTQKDTQLKDEKIKTEAVTRSNIATDTESKREFIYGQKRDNYVKDQTQLNSERAKMESEQFNVEKTKTLIQQMGLENSLINEKITSEQISQISASLDIVEQGSTMPAKILKSYTPLPSGDKSVYKYDKKGNYQGHTTTRTSK